MMDKNELREFNQLKQEVRRLEKVVALMVRRVNALEKQNKTLRSKAHQTGLDVSHIARENESMRRRSSGGF